MKTGVITISSREPWEPYYFHKQFKESAKRQGIEPIYLDAHMYAGLMSKPKFLKKWIEQNGSTYDYLIVCDAWDIIFIGSVDEILRKYSLFDAPIVFNAERNCFPRADLAEQFDKGPTPYRYLNSGFFVGAIDDIYTMLKDMNPDAVLDDHPNGDGTNWNPNDQEYYSLWFLANKHKAELDYHATLCQSLHGADDTEFAWDPVMKRVTSRLTGSMPSVFHGNGGGKEWLKKIMGWMEL